MFKINEIRWPCNVITTTGRLSAFDATASHPPPAALANASWVSSSPEGRVKPSYAPGFRSATHWAWEQLVHQYVLCHQRRRALASQCSPVASGARCEGSNPSGGTGIPCTRPELRRRWLRGLVSGQVPDIVHYASFRPTATA